MNFNKIKLAKNESLCYTAVTTLQDGENKNHRAQGCAAEMGCKAMIKLRNVHKTFGHLEVLKGIDLEVAKGEKLVIIGPSGSGKSTLIRCMNGAGGGHEGRGLHRRAADDAQDARGTQPAVLIDGLSAVQPLPASDGHGQSDAGAGEAQESAQG